MATERLSMRQIREVLRQKWVLGRPHREVAESLRIGLGTVCLVLDKAKQAGLDWPTVQTLTEETLEARLYTRPHVAVPERATRPWPDCAYVHRERRKAGVTLELLHLEYLEQHPDGYRYTQYCEIYRRWLKHRGLSMRQLHRAGEKLFVDYSGKKPTIIEPTTGEVIEVELFVAVLGASNYIYAEATRTQQVPDWIGSHERAFAFFGGVTEVVVPDQLKSGVTVSCRYEPGIQRTYEDFAQHYNTVILPARPKRPRDKPKAEVGVQVAQRWILARLRHERFFSLAALNARIRELLEPLNAKVMRVYRASRRELFVQLDQPALRPLPASPSSSASGRSTRASTSTTTSTSTATTTPSPTNSSTSSSTRPAPRRPSRSSIEVSAWPRTSATIAGVGIRPIPATCRRPIANTSSGRPRA